MSTNADSPKALARRFISEHRAASLATVDKTGKPHVAVVYCVAHKDLSIYFSTRVEGRKFQNLIAHPNVAMAFYNVPALQMLQLSGRAKRVDGLELEQSVLYELMNLRCDNVRGALPPMQLFERGATNELAIIRVKPTEMTFANFATPTTGRYNAIFQAII